MTSHIKHILITLIVIGGLLLGLVLYDKHQERVTDRMADRDKQTAIEQTKAKQAELDIAKSAHDRDIKLAQIEQQRLQKIDSPKAQSLVREVLPGVQVKATKDQQGNSVLSVPDDQATRDAINQATSDYKSCKANMEDCANARTQYEKVIIPAKDAIIKQQTDQLTDMRKFLVPKWTVSIGVGKVQGTNFNNPSGYQPYIGLDRRLTDRIGVFVAAQNKELAAGLSFRFGSTPGHK